MVNQLFSDDLIFLNYETQSAIDFLKKMTHELVARNIVTDTYLDAIIEREKTYPTGLPSEPFPVAIPHGDPIHVIKPCIVVVRPSEPVEFGEMGTIDKTVKAKYIFMLVVKKMSSQIGLLQSLIEMFMNPQAMDELDQATSSTEILQVLHKYIDYREEELT